MPVSRREIWWLLAILLAAFGLRFAAALIFPSVYHPDELYQYLEQGHRLAFGYGVIPWEYRTGIRSWLVPGFLGSLMSITAFFGGGVVAYMAVIGAVLSLLSSSIVVVSWLWARHVAGPAGAIVAAIVAGTWFELIYFGSKPLTGALAASSLFVAAYLLCARRDAGRGFLLAGGFLLGLSFVLRLHVAPAILVIFVWACVGARPRDCVTIILGGLSVVLAAGVADWATLGLPFQSLWKNFYINVAEGRADDFGVSPWYTYIAFLLLRYSGAIVPIAALVLLGARRVPIALAVPVVIVLSHSFIGHKELRFLLPAVPFVLLAAAVGLISLASALEKGRPQIGRMAMIALVLSIWVGTSLVLSVTGEMRTVWTRNSDHLRAFATLRERKDVCGIGILGLNWFDTGGYVTLHRTVPIYLFRDRATFHGDAGAFDVALASRKSNMEEYGFRRSQCFSGQVCLFERPGECVPRPWEEINNVLEKTEQ